MPSTLRAFMVALVATLGLLLVAPRAEAKSLKTTSTKVTKKKTTKRVVHHPWAKSHAKAPQRVRKSSAPKRHPKKG